ncbi:ECF-type sigma factor [Haliangium ochraceum]|uniref:RNA polymerase, sigma-24 subunit, ECF subfamily n=1 Tax=Haliangium ochraceum (strain DSM 14365 / JCM 11303 / SMP-2) TaxID=502025 RepID=D0LUR6_HALO1|nr:ECF-type sigma factor [Haliangium ochraceum]ACY13956.1 RNA polymerase, sigma-24 subunit, ECF subfamily [Haliangium ochraceum DSM 14365]
MAKPTTQFVQAYERLRALAERQYLLSTSSTLQPTALVHEVYLRLVNSDAHGFRDEEHFMAVAATAMRHVLIDRVRRHNASKRGGEWTRVTLEGVALNAASEPVDLLVLDEVLTRLEALDPRQARIVEMRVFGGLTVSEVARTLGVSTRTVEYDWRQARAWMRLELQRSDVS